MKPIKIPKNVKTAITLLNQNNYECFLVGGAVRNALLNEPIHDYDLTTSATPYQTMEVFKDYRVIETGIKHGTVTVRIDHENIEITTYRLDSTYSDHRRPDKVEFTTSLKEDCSRRDFTINAMAYHPSIGLKDYFDGQSDLNKKIIRTVNAPNKRFEEDALRILRAVRFSSRLGFKIEPCTKRAMIQTKEDLKYVSVERIATELFGILSSEHVDLGLLDNRMILEVILPEIKPYSNKEYETLVERMLYIPQNTQHLFECRMAFLLEPLNDIEQAEDIIRRLKYPNVTRIAIKTLLKSTNQPLQTRRDLRYLKHNTDTLFHDALLFNCILNNNIQNNTVSYYYKDMEEKNDCTSFKDMHINGKEVMDYGYKGKQIKEILAFLLEEIMQDHLSNNKQAIHNKLKELSKDRD